MITTEEALNIVDNAIKPERLNSVQELVFVQCWQGRTYQQIASDSGYDPDYIRVVGSRLWQILSDSLGEKITKNNFRSVLRQQFGHPEMGKGVKGYIAALELPDSPVPLDSSLYIQRPPIEAQAYEEIIKPGALIRIKAANKMGKTSLAMRILAKAQSRGYRTVRLNFQQAEERVLGSLDRFLRWVCANITLQLQLESMLDDYWDKDLGDKVSCTTYLQGYILGQLDAPLVIALDEVNRLFAYPEIAQEFLPLLRFWHEEANNLVVWQKLRLIVTHSTEIYIPLNIHQSPFNVGLSLKLPEFDWQQIQELAQLYGLLEEDETIDQRSQLAPSSPQDASSGVSPGRGFQAEGSSAEVSSAVYEPHPEVNLGESFSVYDGRGRVICDMKQLQSLQQLVGGHPYLLNLAFCHLIIQNMSMQELVQEALTETGIYSSHLRGHLVTLRQYIELAAAFKQVVDSSEPIQLNSIAAYELESMGLIKLHNNKAVPMCELYRLYFRDRL